MFKKTLIFAFALLLSINTFSIAQMRMSHEDRVKQYTERLKLTDKQTKKVDTIMTEQEKKMSAITTDDMQERFGQMRKLMDESSKQIEKILTKDQKPEFQKMMEERKNRMNNRGQGAPEKPKN